MSTLDEANLIDRIRGLSWREFELFVALLWELQGWTSEIAEARGDDGRDIIARRDLPFEMTVKIEAKCWSEDNVTGPDIRKYALLPRDDFDHAVAVTSISSTEPAKRTAARHNVKLVDSTRLVHLIQVLDAEELLIDDLNVTEWDQVISTKHLDWTAAHLGAEDDVDIIPGIGRSRS